MAAPFAFLPRVVSKHAKPWQGISRPEPSPDPTSDSDSDSEDGGGDDDDDDDPSPARAKGKEKAIDAKQSAITQDIAALVSLALSDYNIWNDADLRWKLDACLTSETSRDEAGFVPVNYLLRRAPFRGSLSLRSGQTEPSETEVVKALRTHANHSLEVRMRLPSAAPSSVWYGTGKTSRKKDVGGYEVRRKDWPTLRDRPSRAWTRARWDYVTAYMEGIPPGYRTVGGIVRFAELLLSPSSEPRVDAEPRLPIQNVTLPPHYLDRPGDATKSKGYALVTFSTKPHLEEILRAWPWKRHRALVPANDDGVSDGNLSPIAKEAHKYGLRTISKARWDALNEEYLVYKQSLVDEMARTQTEMHRPGESTPGHEIKTESTALNAQTESQTRAQTTTGSLYPYDCLVFVRNVHPETNKTTLKSLFARAFQDSDGGHASPGLDYVDFNKGTDTCYIRLTSPNHSTRLIAYFGAHRAMQADGLDTTGRTPIVDDKPITMEMVQGKKEELYWEKVPEKVRRHAVDRALKAQVATGVESPAQKLPPRTHFDGTNGSGRKKRTRES